MKKQTIIFTQSTRAVKSLIDNDEPLRKLIMKIGDIELKLDNNYFESLIMSIIGQQLSSKAAKTIRNRVRSLSPELTPESTKSLSFDELRNAGLSKAKITYTYDLSEKILSKEIDFENIHRFSNDHVIKELTKVKRIGKWTAEMFLIFSLGRLDVLSLGDLGLQRACRWLYKMAEQPKGKYLETHQSRWEPYFSVVSLYLWEAIDLGLVDSGKNLDEL
ncbi:DNA-3-methyladenine glycosylase family protein [Bacillus massilinigeriensis]|uniref:DNA-3-methyladenine glycosylase family protein n=1 Tax=Bacillus massilionigeriensis TaxID=1805475 RepID=UPI00096AE3CC|nr:DNA-3-methyladenine glycosylase [Bacillus massilionigeriensis]